MLRLVATLASPAKLSATGSSIPYPLAGGARPGAPYWKAGQSVFRTCWPIPNTDRRALRNWDRIQKYPQRATPARRNTIGVFGLGRREPNPFTDKQAELVTTFADQAVIAIENARLFEAEHQRTRELTESLEQQTATSKCLRSSVVLPSICKRYLKLWPKTLSGSVRPTALLFSVSMGSCCVWRWLTTLRRSSRVARAEPNSPWPHSLFRARGVGTSNHSHPRRVG